MHSAGAELHNRSARHRNFLDPSDPRKRQPLAVGREHRVVRVLRASNSTWLRGLERVNEQELLAVPHAYVRHAPAVRGDGERDARGDRDVECDAGRKVEGESRHGARRLWPVAT